MAFCQNSENEAKVIRECKIELRPVVHTVEYPLFIAMRKVPHINQINLEKKFKNFSVQMKGSGYLLHRVLLYTVIQLHCSTPKEKKKPITTVTVTQLKDYYVIDMKLVNFFYHVCESAMHICYFDPKINALL